MASSVCNRVAIVTGGAQGIGRGIAKFLLCHEAGYVRPTPKNTFASNAYGPPATPLTWGVVVVDTDANGIEDARKAFTEMEASSASPSSRIAFVHGDCAKEATAKEALEVALSTFGRVDLLVNNAGGGLDKVPLREQSVEGFYDVLRRNVGTAYVFSKVVGTHWEDEVAAAKEKSDGSNTFPNGTNIKRAIVNISSTRALQSEHFSESYAAGKGGVVALTHALASSLGHVARVNGINLGWIDVSGPSYGPGREAYPLSEEDISQHFCNKVGEPDDVAHAIMFLYENAFMSGQCITLDGGMTKRMHYAE